MKFIQRLSWFTALLVLAGPVSRGAEDADAKKGPVTLSTALKLGPEGLTRYTDSSEAGQDEAASLYATARRIETERTLALRDVALVNELESWRVELRGCRSGSCVLASIVNGGGTMYSHGEARDGAPLEDFLAGLAKRLPLGAGKGSPGAAKRIDGAIAFLKKLKPFDGGDEKEAKAAKAELAAEVNRVVEHWTNLRSMIAELTADEADRIAVFATDSLSWLKDGGEE